MGRTDCGLVALSSIGKQAKQAMRSKPVSITLPWPLYQLLTLDFCSVGVPVLTFFSFELQYRSISRIKHFLLLCYVAADITGRPALFLKGNGGPIDLGEREVSVGN